MKPGVMLVALFLFISGKFVAAAPAAPPEVMFIQAASTVVPAVVTGIVPSSIGAGNPGFTLSVSGTRFTPGSVVRWNNFPRTTTFVDSTLLSATIPPTDIATSGIVQITVTQPDGTPSNSVPFTISNETTLYFAQIAEGKFATGTNKTVLIIANPNDKAVAASVEFFISPTGAPFPIDIGIGIFSAFEVTVPAKGEIVINSPGTRPTAAAGWVRVKSKERIGGLALFQIFNNSGAFVTEAGVGASAVAKSFLVPAEFRDGFESGLALVNPADLAIASVTLKLRNLFGTLIATTTRQLEARQHMAQFLRELFPGVSLVGFQGTIEVESSDPLAATALRTLGGLQTSTLPSVVVPGQ